MPEPEGKTWLCYPTLETPSFFPFVMIKWSLPVMDIPVLTCEPHPWFSDDIRGATRTLCIDTPVSEAPTGCKLLQRSHYFSYDWLKILHHNLCRWIVTLKIYAQVFGLLLTDFVNSFTGLLLPNRRPAMHWIRTNEAMSGERGLECCRPALKYVNI